MAKNNYNLGSYYVNNINFDVERYSKDKKTIADNIGFSVLNKMQSAFRWEGLPDTIPQKWLESQLQVNGFSFITKADDGNLYAFYGGLGGEPDAYYQPTICVIADPGINFNKECVIDEDGILVSNDTYRRGIIPVIGKYAGLLAENTITMRIADIMARISNIISAGDESTRESAKEYLKQIEQGNLGIIQESPFLEDLKINPAATAGEHRLTDLIEVEQYLKASLYNELGLQANYNMKRESINSSEAQLGDDALQPFIDDMLRERKEAAEKINKMFNLNISVEFNSAWRFSKKEREAELKQEEKLAEGVNEDGNTRESDHSGSDADSGNNPDNSEQEKAEE